MQIGAENRKKLALAVGMMVLAIVLLGRTLFSSPSPSPAPAVAAQPTRPAPAAVRPATARTTTTGGKKASAAPRSLDPMLRYDWLKASEDTQYEGHGRNIFRAEAEPPTPVASAVTDNKKAQENTPPAIPPPPPINLKFFGFANKLGEPKKVFLSQGEDVFIAAEGDIIDRRYKILRISPMSVDIEDVLTNNRQSIPLTQG